MTCLTHLVECLKNKGIEPEAYASSVYGSSYVPSKALIYDTSTYYNSKGGTNDPQWWSLNFKQKISLNRYTIRTSTHGTDSVSLYNFTLSVSFDNKTWKVVHDPFQRNKEETTHNSTN